MMEIGTLYSGKQLLQYQNTSPVTTVTSLKKKKEKATAKVRVDMESEISISICSAVFHGERSDNLKSRNVRAVLVLYLEQEE